MRAIAPLDLRDRLLGATAWLPRLVARVPTTVHSKLLVGFLVIAVLLISLGAVGLQVLGRANRRAEDLVQRQQRIAAYRQFQRDTALPPSWFWNDATLEATLQRLNEFRYELDQLQFVAKDDGEPLRRLREDYDRLIDAVTQFLGLMRGGNAAAGREFHLATAGPVAARVERATNDLVNKAEADMAAGLDASEQAYAMSRLVVIAFSFGSIALALALGYAISWALIGPVKLMEARLASVASGDFSQRVEVPNRDELGVLARQFNTMAGQLQTSYAALEDRTHELGRAVEELQALGEVSRAVSATVDLDTVLQTVVGRSVELSQTAGGVIYEYDETTREFDLRAAHHLDEELVEMLRQAPLRFGEGAAGKAAAMRGPVQVADILDESEYGVERIRELFERLGYRALLAVPLFIEQRTLGALVVWRRQPGTFSPDVVNLLQTFATPSALAIQNARLFRELADKSRQLEVASRHKSEFLASMSHELRTPLNAIIGYSEMLQEEATDLGQDPFLPDLRKINAAGKHLLELVNGVLDLSKIEAGRMDLLLETFSVPALISEIVAIIRPLADKNGNRVESHCAPEVAEMRADLTKVRQALFNVLSNACKFTHAGLVSLAVRQEAGDGPKTLLFVVTDTGIGMTEEQLGRLFRDFAQAEASTSRRYGGTGLGLALSRRLCRLMGGDVTAASESGRGSTFTVRLPVVVAEPVPEASLASRDST